MITTRSIPPPGRSERDDAPESIHEDPEPERQPQTINPSLLDCSSESRSRLFSYQATSRRLPNPAQDDIVRRSKPARNTDVLHKARDMGKKIWSLDKLQRMLQSLLEDSALMHNTSTQKPGGGRSLAGGQRPAQEPTLLQLLQNERLNGPSDRDPTVTTRDLIYFKGPYIYVYDIDEKQKPIMVREYPKVANKTDGEWPQFRSVANGRCPFVEEIEDKESRKPKEKKVVKAAVEAPTLQPPEIPAPRPLTGKRTLSQMEDGQNKLEKGATPEEMFKPIRSITSQQLNFQPQNAFISSKAGVGRFFAGEPVASGVQPSNITSAIRSNMISSTSGIHGAKAGTSKEVHGLQRKVLSKGAPAPNDTSSRRLTEMSLDGTSSRSTTLSRADSRKMDLVEEAASGRENKTKVSTGSAAAQLPMKKAKRDLKPGYCENCQDKFRDFDEVRASHLFILRPSTDKTFSISSLASIASLPKTPRIGWN